MIGGVVIGKDSTAARINSKLLAAAASMREGVTAEAFNLVGYVQTNKLHGEVLQQRTGRLSNSITAGPLEDDGRTISRTVGTNVEYARIHEYGGTINHPGGTPYFIDRLAGRAVFVKKDARYAGGLPVTRAHPIPMPERSFLRSSLAELAPGIRERLGARLEKALA